MKPDKKIGAIAIAVTFAACNANKVEPGSYVDLNTGDSIEVIADPETGYAYNASTKKPVYLYVNDRQDTVFTTGMVVNNKLIATTDGKYEVDGAKVKVDDEEVKIKYEDYKKKVDGDSYTIKDGDYKIKVDGEEMKIKDGDYKKKVDGDEIKIKDGDSKIKIEDGVVTKRKN